MSSYIRNTRNPKTGEFEGAYWLDDLYGNHKYGVRFEDGSTYDPTVTPLETNEEPHNATWDEYKERKVKAHDEE